MDKREKEFKIQHYGVIALGILLLTVTVLFVLVGILYSVASDGGRYEEL